MKHVVAYQHLQALEDLQVSLYLKRHPWTESETEEQ